ncbi:MAG: asparagine synthase (glutamine-hydrolyzing), partial [Pirellulales bacterium]|nr:asparagine synthase (glutamine-hydrolyzing) [Pirellulales bacterium]
EAGEKPDRSRLCGMISLLSHRGPDEKGIFTDRNVGLAHARLSIIDLEGGRQPIQNEDRSLTIVFNGEIFNYRELRRDLIAGGHRFSTASDTEVILHLYEDRGTDCVHQLNGQWAFAIWDSRKSRLFASRDPLGIRPFFYAEAAKRFFFASEVKSLFVNEELTREIDLEALDEIFTIWTTIPPRTVFKDVHELPPGHNLTVENGSIDVRPYRQLGYGGIDASLTEEDCSEKLIELLVNSVRLRLRSDVPVGAYLSGGLDSSLTCALIRKFTDAPIRTFSVTFDSAEFDESPYQKEVVRFLGTEHQEVRCTKDDIGRVFPDVLWHTEKPVVRTAPAPLFLLSKLVREEGYKVVVTGEGADELLGGYDIYKEAKIRRFWGAAPDSKTRPLLLKRLYPYLKNLQSQSSDYLRAFFHVRQEDLSNPFFSHLPRWAMTSGIKIFFSRDVKAALKGFDVYRELCGELPAEFDGWDGFSRAQYLETRYFLPGYLLSSQGDRMAMAHSVEGRYPFLDPEVVDFSARIPPRVKMKALNEKYVLKRGAGGLVPPSVLKRPKQPYRSPDAVSFFSGGERPERLEYVEELLSESRIKENGLFDAGSVKKLVEKARSGRVTGIRDNMAFVGILSTQLVVEQFVRNFGKRAKNEADRRSGAAIRNR